MHFEVFVEDRSGKTALDILIPKIVGDQHTFRVIPYQGIGRIPQNLTTHNNESPSFRYFQKKLRELT